MIKNIVFDFGQVLVRFEPSYIVGRHTSDPQTAKLIEDVGFDRAYWNKLDAGEVSDVIFISGIDRGYFVIYKLEKSDAHFVSSYDAVAESYLNNLIGTELRTIGTSLAESANYTGTFNSLTHADISMD